MPKPPSARKIIVTKILPDPKYPSAPPMERAHCQSKYWK
jgi:hypothetical protein